ncbi:MAG: molybdopterin-dependent oxidoreductase [Candidatus Heimdallarchaeota archaeon]
MNKKTAIILAVVIANIVLIGTVVTLYFTVFQGDDQVEEGKIIITGLVDKQINLTLADLEAMPNITQEYILNGNPNIIADYTGVSLAYLIFEIANVTGDYNARVIAIDKYSYSLSFDEIIASPDIIIAYKKDGAYIEPRTEGGNGPFRLIIPAKFEGDFNGQYCIKYVAEIKIYE